MSGNHDLGLGFMGLAVRDFEQLLVPVSCDVFDVCLRESPQDTVKHNKYDSRHAKP